MWQRAKSQPLTWLLLGLSIALVIWFGLQSANAAQIRVSLEPVPDANGIARNVFDLVADPGSTIEEEAVIRNSSEEAVKAFVFTSGFEVRDNQVLPVIATPDTELDPGTWITLEKNELIIPAGQAARIKFTVKVPESLDVGEHQATLFTQGQSLTAPATSASGFTIVIRNGVRVYMVVPGQIDRTLVISKIRHRIEPFWQLLNRKLYFSMDFENKGNITLRPKTNIKVSGLFGKVGEMKDVEFIKIGRGTSQTGEAVWDKKAPILGRFVADFEIHMGEKEQVNEDRTRTKLPDEVINKRYVFWVLPWLYIFYLLLFIFILYLVRSTLLYFAIINRLKIKTDIYTVKSGDTLMKVASNLGVDPTVLAKFNFLPWPHTLNAGDKLLVPTGRMSQMEWKDRARSLVRSEFLGTIAKNMFKRRAVRDISNRLEGNGGPPSKSQTADYEVLIADRGDTLEDIADFANISPDLVIELNHLRYPFKLRAGQEIKVPKAKAKVVRSAPKPVAKPKAKPAKTKKRTR